MAISRFNVNFITVIHTIFESCAFIVRIAHHGTFFNSFVFGKRNVMPMFASSSLVGELICCNSGFSLPDVMTFLSMVVKADPSRSFDVTLNGIILFFVFRSSECSFLSVTGLFSFFPGRGFAEESVFYSSSFPLSCGLCLILKVEGFSISGKGGDDGEFGVHI